MPEPITSVGFGLIAAYLGKDGLQKLLGPTADYLGGELQQFTQRRVETVGEIFQNADKKLGGKIELPGSVPARVLKEVINEGSYFEDQLAVEYIGGVLASSRTESGRDDRGVRIAKLVGTLSTYQLRAHYLVYSAIREVFKTKGLPFNMEGRPKMEVFIPFSGFNSSMEFDQSELKQLVQLTGHIFFGLHSENLIEGAWQYGSKENMVLRYPDATEEGIICQPSALGAELFLSAFGAADKPLEYIFSDDFQPVAAGSSISTEFVVATKK